MQPSNFEDSIVITIGLLLEPDQEAAAVSLSKQICTPEQCSFQLDSVQNPPRVRLYEAIFPVSEESHVLDSVRKLAIHMIPFSMKWGSSEITPHIIAKWGETNEPLDLFHDAVLETISPMRHGLFKQKYLHDIQNLTYDEKVSFERWGSPWAHPYRPHMILAKSASTFHSTPSEYSWPFHRCTFTGIIIGSRSKKVFESVNRIPFSGQSTA